MKYHGSFKNENGKETALRAETSRSAQENLKHGYQVLEMCEQKYIRLDTELQCKIADFSSLIV